MTTITMVGNSPGEISTFVRPVAAELSRKHPEWRQEIALVPCPYATGAEAEVIRSWGLAHQVWSPSQTTLQWLRGRSRRPGVVCFLGGDPWHALLLKQRFRVPAVAYFPEPSSWERTRWLGGFDRVLLGYGETRPLAGVSAGAPGAHSQAVQQQRDERTSFLGDLRVDAVKARLQELSLEPPAKGKAGSTLAIFPGSRWIHLKASMGPFQRVVDLLAQQRPEQRFMLSVSPFVTRAQLADAAAKPLNFGLARSRGRLVGDLLLTEGGASIELVWGDPYRVIAQCDLALSLPGTNTAELAIAGKPTVVPISDRVPIGGGGLLGLLDRLPGFGRLKHYLKHRKYKRLGLLALPNQLAGRMVMPELFVRDDLTDLFDFLSQLLDNAAERERIGSEARLVMGPPGAAQRLVETVEAVLEKA